MRDLLMISFILGGALWALRQPWIGVMLWTWVSIMNPHRYTWRASEWPLAAIVAGCTLIGLMMTRDRRSPLAGPPAWTLLIFMVWVSVVLPLSFDVEGSYGMYSRVMKIDLMILVTVALIYTRQHIWWLVLITTFSLGFYGVKGGIFTIVSGGSFRVWGPPDSFIEGNNELALALIILIPLLRFIQLQLASKWARHAMLAAMLLCAVAAIGSQSRGALLAIVGMGGFLWWRSEQKVLSGVAIAVVAAAVVAFMPDQWSGRMNTIQTYDQDASALGRINAWWMTFNLAKDRIIGGGFDIYTQQLFQIYAPDPTDIHVAHSIYFQILGEQGFIGLFLFLLMWALVWLSAGWLRKHGRVQASTHWASDLGAMCQVSLVGYAVGGAFLSLAYFDLPYILLVLVVAARRWLEQGLWQSDTSPMRWSALAPAPPLRRKTWAPA